MRHSMKSVVNCVIPQWPWSRLDPVPETKLLHTWKSLGHLEHADLSIYYLSIKCVHRINNSSAWHFTRWHLEIDWLVLPELVTMTFHVENSTSTVICIVQSLCSPAYSTGLTMILLLILVKQVANVTVVLPKQHVALLANLLCLEEGYN